jgi:hypothetical protein
LVISELENIAHFFRLKISGAWSNWFDSVGCTGFEYERKGLDETLELLSC